MKIHIKSYEIQSSHQQSQDNMNYPRIASRNSFEMLK